MKLNLTIDSGNSSTKLSLFRGETFVGTERYKQLDASMLKRFMANYDIGAVIVSSVTGNDPEAEAFLSDAVPTFIKLSSATPLPIRILYRSANTLGCDRIATAVEAWHANAGAPSLIVDVGTATTLDVVDAEGNFLGGNISPGITMRMKSLNMLTSRLPLVDKDGETPLFGVDTYTAIRSGVIRGLAYEIDGTISSLESRMPGITTFLTGGDSKLMSGMLSHRVTVDNNMLAKGLNRILLYNEKSI